MRGAEVCRRPMADLFFLRHCLCRLARAISRDPSLVNATATLSPVEHNELIHLAKEALQRHTIPFGSWCHHKAVEHVDFLYTDATLTGVGFVYFKRSGLSYSVTARYGLVPSELGMPIHDTEALAVRWALASIQPHRNLHIYIDNQIVVNALRKGHGSTREVNAAAYQAALREGNTTISWVASEDNVADGPSRGKHLTPTNLTQGPELPANDEILLRRWESTVHAPPKSFHVSVVTEGWTTHDESMDIN